jgi:hypothetical protein
MSVVTLFCPRCGAEVIAEQGLAMVEAVKAHNLVCQDERLHVALVKSIEHVPYEPLVVKIHRQRVEAGVGRGVDLVPREAVLKLLEEFRPSGAIEHYMRWKELKEAVKGL